MRDEPTRIEEQVRLAFAGESWHGPSVLESLNGVSADMAAERPIPGAHSIWEIVLHLTITYRAVVRRMQGQPWFLTDEEEWPKEPAPDANRWRQALEDLRTLNQEVREHILTFEANRLDNPIAPGHSTAYTHFAGLSRHDAYHAGQIMLLRKLLTN